MSEGEQSVKLGRLRIGRFWSVVITLVVGGWQQFAKTLESGAHHGGDLFIPKWISRGAFVLAFFVVMLRMAQILWIDLVAAIRGRAAPTPT